MLKYNARENNNYLKFEKENFDFMDKNAVLENRKKYGFTELELKRFYGQEYDNYRVWVDKKGKAYKPKKPSNITIKKEKKEIKCPISKEDLYKQIEEFKYIYPLEDNVYVRFLNKSNGEYFSLKTEDLTNINKLSSNLALLGGKENLFFSLNCFNTYRGATDRDLHLLTTIAIDVDFKDITRLKGISPLDIVKLLEKQEFNKSIPRPQVVEYANCLRLKYIMEKVACTASSKTLAKKIGQVIGERLSDYGASGQPLTTHARIIGSINPRNNSKVQIMYLEKDKYTLKELSEKWLPALPEWYPEWKAKTKRKVVNLSANFTERSSYYKTNLMRIDDFYRIQKFFDYECDGFKRFLCFQIRNQCLFAGMSTEESKEVMRDFNNRFKNPLRWNVIEQDTRNVERKQYKYLNETILKFIGIEPEDEILLKLESIMSETESKRRNNVRTKEYQKAKYRDASGLTKTEQKRLQEFIQIAELELEGLSYKKIAQELNKDLSNMLKKIKKIYDKNNYLEVLEETKQGKYKKIRFIG